MEKKKQVNIPRSGMKRNVSPSELNEGEYIFMLNGNSESIDGNKTILTNEPSDILAVNYPAGYKVIGYEKHPTERLTYVFLTNPSTGFSSVGYIDNDTSPVTVIPDTEVECPECLYYNTLATPLENLTQSPYNTYTEIFNDLCNKAFNFSINRPIKHIEIKIDKIGTRIYWVDDYNPDRYFDAENIEYYKTVGEIICGVDNTEPVCVNVEKMLQSPNFTLPDITPDVIQIGGNLRMGTYQFLMAYCDAAGNEISDYEAITQPIDIFDENNRVLNQTELDSFTNFGINLTLNYVDETFRFYKVVVIERVAINQAESYFVEGIHPTSDKSILYTSTQTGTENIGGITQRINIERLFSVRVKYEHTRGIESSNNMLYKWGLTSKKIPNLQPVVNLMGGFLKWNSSIAKEDLYKDAIATSRYRGYMREEVQPFGIRFFNKDGSKYPLLPFVARPAIATDLEILPPTDTNLSSVLAKDTGCSTTDRNKRWQIYNTATVEGSCADLNSGTIIEEQRSSCIVNDVDTLEDSSIYLALPDGISDLKTYVNDDIDAIIDPTSPKYIAELVPYLTGEYPDDNCEPNFTEGCDSPVLESYSVLIQEVVNEEQDPAFNEDIDTYSRNVPPSLCQSFQIDNTGAYVADTAFQTDYALTTVYKRQLGFVNESCTYAEPVQNNNPPISPAQGYYHNYYGALTSAALIDVAYTGLDTNANFLAGLHQGALWFKINKNGRDQILFEITPTGACNDVDDIPVINQLRYSFFDNCSDTTATGSTIVSTASGDFILLDITAFPDTFYVAVEAPIVETANAKFRTAPPCGCFGLITRTLQLTGTTISFDSIIFQKQETYISNCTYDIPEVNECKPIPYQYGAFAYWESTNTYPDNEELYNSSKLLIEPTDLVNLTEVQKQQFRDYYTDGNNTGTYILKEDTDLRCKPVRHYKFPSNIISPFMGTGNNAPFNEGLIFPLGVSIDNDVINAFLDIAVKNNILSQSQRDEIEGYEIFKGDNSVHKSIITNAVGFDMYRYTENGDSVLYPNYPLNDLGVDIPQQQNGTGIPHPFAGVGNHNFSLLSPEFSLTKPTIPTEMIISGYQMGESRIYFQDVDDHPRYVLLTQTAKNVALVLAIGEVLLETAYKLADMTVKSGIGHLWVVGGTSTGTNAGGVTASITALAVYAGVETINSVINVGQYRLQWLQIMEDLGQPRNFASYCAAEGYHNRFLTNSLQTELLRGVSASKYIKSGRWTFKDEMTGQTIKINNVDREYSTFISTGSDYPINYPAQYYTYDNNALSSDGSRTIISLSNSDQNREIVHRSAVPYFTLKNYIPNQFGEVGSIKWLSTSHRRRLTDITNCDPIFGGTVFICRDTQERKHPIFVTDAFGQANMTPFKYTDYSNIGDARFFIDFRTGGDSSIGDFLFPDLDSDYVLDVPQGKQLDSGLYVNSTSKFYLYYYGFASYLIESEVNTNFRYGRREIKDQYYPDIQGDMVEFTQQRNRRITEPPTYFYNSVYSRGVTQTPFSTNPTTYSKEVFDKINDAENGVIWSLQDNTPNDLTDPWLVYLPLNFYDNFPQKYGKLVELRDIESQTILGRFENFQVVFNSIDNLANQLNPISTELGTGGVFTKRPQEFQSTDLGYGGTQTTDMVSTPYGHFTVDAKRGQIFQQNGRELSPISDIINGKDSGLKNWLRQQLPFKILKDFPEADIDNKFKGLGVSIGYDPRFDRVFITKNDYKVINKECLQWDDELGIVINEGECGQDPVITCPPGYVYNEETQWCEKPIQFPACPAGYTYNEISGMCETQGSQTLMCPVGWDYDSDDELCTNGVDTELAVPCGEGCVVVIQPDGNALCVCPGDQIEDLCEDCPVSGEETCGEGYAYNPTTDKCEKLIEPCPPSEGYFTGGVFSNTSFRRIYNSVNNLLDINNGFVQDIQRQQDGKILVGGGFTSTTEGAIKCMFRLNFDGTFDNTFNIGAGFTGTLTSVVPTVWGIDTYEDGKIIAVGDFTTFNGTIVNGIVRLNSDGSIDPTFTPLAGFNTSPLSVRVVEGDKILVGCAGTYRGTSTKGILKLLANGDPDPTFTGGNRLDSFTQGNASNEFKQVYSIEIQPDGKYLIGGHFREYSGVLCRKLTRINTNGFIDVTFNVGQGFIDIPTPDNQANLAYIYKVQMQGNKILAAGKFKTYKGQPAEGIVRLSLGGVMDSSFNNNKVMGGSDAIGRTIFDFDTDSTGEILIGGSFTSYDGNGSQFIALTDVNGFPQSFADPMFNATIFTVLNEPRCETCPCTQTLTPENMILCSCDPTIGDPQCNCIDQVNPEFEDILSPIDYDNTDYFEPASWTIAFKCDEARWISMYSFLPNYYISHSEYFQGGYNYGQYKEKLWSHLLLGNNSQQVFGGDLYPWIVEYVTKNNITPNILQTISYNLEARRYHNEEDYASVRNVGFDYGTIYNSTNNSGRLKFEPQRTIRDTSRYPQTNGQVQSILFTDLDNRKTFNYFYNRVVNQDNNVPIWIWDNIMVQKNLNPQAVSFKGKKTLERMRGDYHVMRMENTSQSRYKMYFSFSTEDQQFYQ